MKKENNGTCYADAFCFILSPNNQVTDIRLVHGSVFSTYFKRRIDHAWVELGNGDVVIDTTINFTGQSDKYYALAKAKVDAKYTQKEMIAAAVQAKTYGPWKKNFKIKLDKQIKK